MSENKWRGLIKIHLLVIQATTNRVPLRQERLYRDSNPRVKCVGQKCQAASSRELRGQANREGNRFLCYLLQESPGQIMPAGFSGSTQQSHPATPGHEGSAQCPGALRCSGRNQINGNQGSAAHFHGSAKELIYPGVHTRAL